MSSLLDAKFEFDLITLMSKIVKFFDCAFSCNTKIETQSSLLVLYHLNQLQLKVKPKKYKKYNTFLKIILNSI